MRVHFVIINSAYNFIHQRLIVTWPFKPHTLYILTVGSYIVIKVRANTNRIIYATMVLLGLLDVLVVFHIKTESYGIYYSILTFMCAPTTIALFALTIFRVQKVIKDIGAKSWLTGMLKMNNIPFFALVMFLNVYATNSFDENWEKIPGVTEIKNGQYLITNHGETVKTLTKEEYNLFADMERNLWISGFLFFGAGTLLLNRFNNNTAANNGYKTYAVL